MNTKFEVRFRVWMLVDFTLGWWRMNISGQIWAISSTIKKRRGQCIFASNNVKRFLVQIRHIPSKGHLARHQNCGGFWYERLGDELSLLQNNPEFLETGNIIVLLLIQLHNLISLSFHTNSTQICTRILQLVNY